MATWRSGDAADCKSDCGIENIASFCTTLLKISAKTGLFRQFCTTFDALDTHTRHDHRQHARAWRPPPRYPVPRMPPSRDPIGRWPVRRYRDPGLWRAAQMLSVRIAEHRLPAELDGACRAWEWRQGGGIGSVYLLPEMQKAAAPARRLRRRLSLGRIAKHWRVPRGAC